MKKKFIAIALVTLAGSAFAQKPMPAEIHEFGKFDKAELELKSCDFEPDANAEVLFDKADVYYDNVFNICMDRQKRIKIFNDNGKDEANITIEYYGNHNYESISGLQAETINLVDGKPEIIKIDKKQVFTKQLDKQRYALVFSMPNVKPGSIIEFKYRWETQSFSNMPDWSYQDKIPVKYSELKTLIPEFLYFRTQTRGFFQYTSVKTEGKSQTIGAGTDVFPYNSEEQTRILTDVRSLQDEPYMTSDVDNLKGIYFHLTTIRPVGGFVRNYSDTWAKVGGILADDEDFGAQLKRKLTGEDVIIAKAKTMKTDEEKIAYLFNYVKTNMKWNGYDDWYTNDGTSNAWEKKTGNSAEVNLILYHLLKGAGVKAYPAVVSTREHGKVNPAFSFLSQFNRAVVYFRVDSNTRYILDATSKYNLYNETPSNLLNSYGLYIDKDREVYDTFFISKKAPAANFISIDAEITPEGKIAGTAYISSMSYNRINALKRYKEDGEKKYLDYLSDGNNNLKITELKMENMEADSLPLNQTMKINMDLAGSDGTYIYLNANLLTSMHKNPFTAETRSSDIDFGYMQNMQLNSTYKIPAGFKIDALPKSVSMSLPDNSLIFKRTIIAQDGSLTVRYTVSHKKSIFFKEKYDEFHEFYKKMHEMMNEQVVLKKA